MKASEQRGSVCLRGLDYWTLQSIRYPSLTSFRAYIYVLVDGQEFAQSGGILSSFPTYCILARPPIQTESFFVQSLISEHVSQLRFVEKITSVYFAVDESCEEAAMERARDVEGRCS